MLDLSGVGGGAEEDARARSRGRMQASRVAFALASLIRRHQPRQTAGTESDGQMGSEGRAVRRSHQSLQSFCQSNFVTMAQQNGKGTKKASTCNEVCPCGPDYCSS